MRVRTNVAVIEHDLATDWRDSAECVRVADAIDFFPAPGASAVEAKTVCAGCSVRDQCLEYALRWEHLCGVWGGLTERERRTLRRTGAPANER